MQKPRVLDESPVAAAIQYAANQKAALYRFLDDGRLPIHNNVSERSLRRQVLGRRNWLFLGSEDGAVANTTYVHRRTVTLIPYERKGANLALVHLASGLIAFQQARRR